MNGIRKYFFSHTTDNLIHSVIFYHRQKGVRNQRTLERFVCQSVLLSEYVAFELKLYLYNEQFEKLFARLRRHLYVSPFIDLYSPIKSIVSSKDALMISRTKAKHDNIEI